MSKYDAFMLFFRGLARHAPGSDAATLQALESCNLPEDPTVFDLGAGTGASALVLAEALNTPVVAVDQLKESLETAKMRAERRGIGELIIPRVDDFLELEVPDGSINLIWSEGSIYSVGWRPALEAWKPLLAPGGYIVATDAVWLTEDRPDEAVVFWAREYPEMLTQDEVIKEAESAGFEVVESFEMMRHAWADYYGPLKQRAALVESSEPGDDLRDVVDEIEEEIRIFEAHGHAWNYMFFVLQQA